MGLFRKKYNPTQDLIAINSYDVTVWMVWRYIYRLKQKWPSAHFGFRHEFRRDGTKVFVIYGLRTVGADIKQYFDDRCPAMIEQECLAIPLDDPVTENIETDYVTWKNGFEEVIFKEKPKEGKFESKYQENTDQEAGDKQVAESLKCTPGIADDTVCGPTLELKGEWETCMVIDHADLIIPITIKRFLCDIESSIVGEERIKDMDANTYTNAKLKYTQYIFTSYYEDRHTVYNKTFLSIMSNHKGIIEKLKQTDPDKLRQKLEGYMPISWKVDPMYFDTLAYISREKEEREADDKQE